MVDEWHELLSTKRGTQTELCLARLRYLRPELRTWALSASLANLEEAAQAVSGQTPPVIVQSDIQRKTLIRSVLPESITTFPRAGQLGSAMVLPLLRELDIEAFDADFYQHPAAGGAVVSAFAGRGLGLCGQAGAAPRQHR